METLGMVHFFAIVGCWTYYLQGRIEPWPQWAVIPSYVILTTGIGLAAFLVGVAYT